MPLRHCCSLPVWFISLGKRPGSGAVCPEAPLRCPAAVLTSVNARASGTPYRYSYQQSKKSRSWIRGWNMMSLDKGSIIAGSHSMPVAEIEHNSEDGNRGGLLPLARKMPSIVPAEISIKSRAECGCGLPKRGKRQAAMTTEIILSPSATAAVASAFRSHLLAVADLSCWELITCALRGRAEERSP